MNDYFLRTIVVTVYIITIMYYYYIYLLISVFQNKNNNRCDPLIMVAGKLSGFENSATSFKTCIQDVQPMIYSEIVNTNNAMSEKINNITEEMKKENDDFLDKLNDDYLTENKKLTNNMNNLVQSKEDMDDKINETNESITKSLNKINDII